MSLNGLDGATVVEAHQAALVEAGGWQVTLLLKYASRDTVELLGGGTGGVGEARLAIEKYGEKSPLYGLVQYRRRKVVLKYVPEGTSRLLQARLAVQFQSILETFSPHETVFSFKAASELNESTLASACMLHTSAASLTSDSSSSLRRSKLGGIAEDVEEGSAAPVGRGRNVTTPEILEDSDITVDSSAMVAANELTLSKREKETAPKQDNDLPLRSDSLPPPKAVSSPVLQEDLSSAHSPKINKSPSVRSPHNETPSVHLPPEKPPSPGLPYNKPLPAPPEASPHAKHQDLQLVHQEEEHDFEYRSRKSQDTTRPSFDRRRSSQTVRAQADDAASQYSAYSAYKPKKKLGPRPHKDPGGRPKTSGAASKDQRAIASLPTNLRISNRAAIPNVSRPGSQQSSRSVPSNFRHRTELLSSTPPPLPQPPQHITELYNPTATGPFISTTALNLQKGPSVTPEKLRLMKALQMRKKQQALAKRTSLTKPTLDVDAQTSGEKVPNRGQTAGQRSSEPVEAEPSAIESAIVQQDTGNEPDNEPEKQINPAPHRSPDENTKVQLPLSLKAENDLPTEDSNIRDTTVIEERKKEPAIERDSGVSSLANVETSLHDPFVVPSPGIKPEAQKQFEADQTKQAMSEATSDNPVTDLKFNKPQAPVVAASLSSPSVLDTSEGQRQSAMNQNIIASNAEAARSVSELSQADTPDRNKKRRPLVEPIKVLSSPEASDMSDDASFIEELQHAKLEQAKPISVARSPITPIFKTGFDRPGEGTRASSAPMQAKADTSAPTPEKPRSIGGRSTSTALPTLPSTTGDSGYALAAKKGTVSSGITTRIKALESFSRRETSGSPPHTAQPQLISQKSSPSMWSFKKRTSLAQIRSNMPNVSASKLLPGEISTTKPAPMGDQTPSSPPRPWLQRPGSVTQIDTPMQKGDSISVTARIIRDPTQNIAEAKDNTSELGPTSLHRSPLIVEHERSEPQTQSIISSTASTIRPDSRPTSPKVERTRFSFSSTRPSVPRLPKSDSMASQMSHRKESGNVPLSPSDASSIAEDRPKASRASRLMKRMSNLTGGSRRNIFNSLSPNGREQNPPAPIAEHRESLTEQSSWSGSVSHIVDIGDVNVQFPDTLLWKRRFMKIDDQGYLVLTPPTKETMERTRGISRKFHLSEFKKPTLPDPEREELPWSILLDLEDGTCLQCACESRYAQIQVLRMLVDAHSAYHQLYIQ